MRSLYHPNRSDISLPAVLHALSDPTRLQIVEQLAACGERPCNGLQLSIPKPTLSHHIKVLRESGVIHTRVEGTQRLSTLRRDDLDDRFPGLLDAVLQAPAPARV